VDLPDHEAVPLQASQRLSQHLLGDAPDAALELAGPLGDPEGQAYALWHRSEALSALERFVEAESAAREWRMFSAGVDRVLGGLL